MIILTSSGTTHTMPHINPTTLIQPLRGRMPKKIRSLNKTNKSLTLYWRSPFVFRPTFSGGVSLKLYDGKRGKRAQNLSSYATIFNILTFTLKKLSFRNQCVSSITSSNATAATAMWTSSKILIWHNAPRTSASSTS